MRQTLLRRDCYLDSVLLMQLSHRLKQEFQHRAAELVVTQSTPANLDLLRGMGFHQGLEGAGPSDLVVAVDSDEPDILTSIAERVDAAGHHAPSDAEAAGFGPPPRSIGEAVRLDPNSNMAVISVPGPFAAAEAEKALAAGLNVMLFSDNVSVEEECRLKAMAVRKNLLLMGPDCGTAIVNGVPLCFANRVRRGAIGVVGASGTGVQEVAVRVHQAGGGISQALGTGGRDVGREVAGAMTVHAIRMLDADPSTKVLVVVSKPPAAETAARILGELRGIGKPAVVRFVGCPPSPHEPERGLFFAGDLEDAAVMAAELAVGKTPGDPSKRQPCGDLAARAATAAERLGSARCHLRGFFTGGTLCDEALFILSEGGGREFRSNVHPDPRMRLADPLVSVGHCLVDTGDDLFTRGRPHPMIEPEVRNQRMDKDMDDPSAAVVLLDLVLGHGSHPDPAGGLLTAVGRWRSRGACGGDGGPLFVASVTGTDEDPQRASRQADALATAGVLVAESGARAARLARLVLDSIESRGGGLP